MADHNINADQIGVYEIPLQAGVVTTVHVQSRYNMSVAGVTVSVHDGDTPVYAKVSKAIAVKDQDATVANVGTWVTLPTGYSTPDATIALISSTAAIVSVSRA